VNYLIAGLVLLIVALVIENARRGDPKARITGSNAGDGGAGGSA
jgi:hypothetical protein